MIHFLVPHESNNFRARVLHHPFLLFYVLFFFTLQLVSVYVRSVNPDILGYATDISVEKVLELANLERVRANLPPLSFSPQLSTAAVNKAHDMFQNNYWAHISPAGVTPWTFILNAGYNYNYAGENLAKNFSTSPEVITAWMNSPTHRANLLKPEYKEIGLAVVNGTLLGEETTLVVQEFGSRSNAGSLALAQKNVAPVPTSTPVPIESVMVASAGGIPTPAIAVSEPEIPVVANVQPISKEAASPKPVFLLSLLGGMYNRTLALLTAEFLLAVLLFDTIYMWRRQEVRLSGHSLAHIIFFAALIGAISATGVGAIL